MNAAFLATVYANYIGPGGGSAAARAKRYECWAETQVGPHAMVVHSAQHCADLHCICTPLELNLFGVDFTCKHACLHSCL